MGKLWDKGYQLDPDIEAFTVGEDYLLDRKLVEADVLGSIAHAKMLSRIGILTDEEFSGLKAGLAEILELHQAGRFEIKRADEDVHTAVENYLTGRLGELGKKLHTARSRNDQVATDVRIFARDRLLGIKKALLDLVEVLIDFAARHKAVPMLGRTHTQPAMPSSVGLWAGAFAESLLDDLKLLETAYELNNQCPLGSAASFGVNLPIDRELTAELLGFAKVQNNVLYAGTSRGKIEAIILFALSQVADDLSKLAHDLIFFSIPETGYFKLPQEFLPGSSIMPQKKNPGPLELVRARAASVTACLFQTLSITRPLYSGYSRDLQETKGPLMRGLDTTEKCLAVLAKILAALEVDEEALRKAFTPAVFAADEAMKLVQKGIPFREAYRQVAAELEKLAAQDPKENILAKTHVGAPGNLGLDKLEEQLASARKKLQAESSRLEKVKGNLLSL